MSEKANSDVATDSWKIITDNIKLGITHALLLVSVVLIGFGIKKNFFDSDRKKAKKLLSSLGLHDILPSLNNYEISIASQLIKPSDIDVTFKDVGGLDNVLTSIKSKIIFPLVSYRFLKHKSSFFQPPKGVLLYGPPGCGKTLIAKAVAKEANARFLNLEIPTLTDKLYGESQKYALAVFTLAEKIQPCIIFIDEIDTFLRVRGKNDHEVTAMIKAQFMMMWDGLKNTSGIVILGATNRPFDVDEAILRRMPIKFEIEKPNFNSRRKILELFLENEKLDSDVEIDKLAEMTDGFSGSDLKEMCRDAISAPLREQENLVLRLVESNDEEKIERFLNGIRSNNFNDFHLAVQSIINGRKWQTENNFCSHNHLEN